MRIELSKVYCRPKTEEEWRLLGLKPHIYAEKSAVAWSNDMPSNNGIFGPTNPHLLKLQGRIEVTVSKFLDLHEDRIVPWRLEEIGFRDMPTISNKGRWILRLENGMNIIIFEDMIPFLEVSYNELKEIYATTFSELEMLIKFLTPPKQ